MLGTVLNAKNKKQACDCPLSLTVNKRMKVCMYVYMYSKLIR